MALQQILLATAIAAALGGGGATMNPLDKHADITLSGGDLTVSKTTGGSWRSVRSTNSHADGFYYFEAQCVVKDASGGQLIGIMPSSEPLTNYAGQIVNSIGWSYATAGNRTIYQGNVNRNSTATTVAAGGYAGFAVRLDSTTGAVRVWVRTSNVAGWVGGGDPALNSAPSYSFTGSAGVSYYATLCLYGLTDSAAVNLGGGGFNMTKPLGAASWQDNAAPTYADPFWPGTALLAAFTGTDGAVTATDLTGRHTFTFVGNAQIDTDNADFATGALLLDGSGDYLTVVGELGDFSIPAVSGTLGDFTIEVWAKSTAITGARSYIGNYAGAGSGWRLGTYTGGTGIEFRNADSQVMTRAVAMANNVRDHIAVCRSGSDTRIFKNGVQVGATFTTFGAIGNANSLAIGALSGTYPSNEQWAGWISYLRVTRAARYTANFTPPSTPLPTV